MMDAGLPLRRDGEPGGHDPAARGRDPAATVAAHPPETAVDVDGRFEYRLLGPFEVWRDGVPLALGGRRQRAVLAMLLLAANRTVGDDALLDGVWSGAPPAQALTTLHSYITHLRRALEPERAPRAPARVLLRDAGGYRLHVPAGASDVGRFSTGVAAAAAASAAGDAATAATLAARALAEWRGPALTDFADDQFAVGHARQLEEARLQAVELRVEADLAAGRHAAVIGELAALVADHPTRERLRGQLMLALYRAGRQADALQVARDGRRRLAEELGIDPDPSLQALEAAILRHDRTLDLPPAAEQAPGRPSAEDAGSPPVEPFAAAPPPADGCVVSPAASPAARAEERAVLAATLASVRDGGGRVVLIGGEPGIGKTWLLEAFAGEVADASVRWGRCHDSVGAPPFWPWRQILGDLAVDTDSATLERLLGSDAGVVLDVAPELATHIGGASPVRLPDAETARFRFFEAVGRLLDGLSRQRPLVLLLEDLHWADPSSLALLRAVVQRLRRASVPPPLRATGASGSDGATEAGPRLLVVATYRDVAAGDRAHLAPTLGALAREPTVERLRLRGLTREGTADLVAGLLGGPADGQAIDAIADRTGGNPLFVVHLARLLQDVRAGRDAESRADAVDVQTLVRTRVPPAVVDLIGWQVAELPEATRRLLELAAVIGRTFDLDVVVRTQALTHDRALDAAEPAVAAGIVEETDVGGSFRFTHALIREAILAGVGPARVARLHGRVGDTLAGAGADTGPLPVVAHHYWMAAQVGWAPQALDAAVAAAHAALSGLAFEAAQAQLDRAQQLLDAQPAGPARDRAELGIRLQSATHLMRTRGYGVEEVGVGCRRARELAPRHAPEFLVASWGLAAHHLVRGEHRAATRIGAQLLAIAEQTGDRVAELAGHQTSGAPSIYLAEYDAAVDHLARVVDIARSLPAAVLARFPQDVHAGGLAFLALASWLRGDAGAAEAQRLEAVTLGEGAGGYDEVFVRMVSSQMGVLARAPAQVLDDTGAMLAACGDTGFAHLAAHARVMRGWALALTGEPEEGLALVRRGMDHFARYERSARRSHNLTLLAEVLARSGRQERAAATAEAAIAEVTASEERFFAPETLMTAARVRPDDERVPAWLEEAVTAAAAAGAAPLHERARALCAAMGVTDGRTAVTGE